jgi:hypothetical protein
MCKYRNYDLSTAAQMKIRMAMIRAGHQNSPTAQKKTPIAIKQPLDSFDLIGCPQCGHFSADFESSLLQAGQVISPVIYFFFAIYLFQSLIKVGRAAIAHNIPNTNTP